jgi:N-acetylglucosaminyldiphosphoundecaprenol N-acetyl-beta-D-mannosaminyltransferase
VALDFANTQIVTMRRHEPGFRELTTAYDGFPPDGMPLVWMLRLKGHRAQPRVYGPTLTLHLLAAAAAKGVPVGFFGGTPEVLDSLSQRMTARYPGLKIVFAYSPPFRPLDDREDEEVVAALRASGARLLFVGLGCPKQERWIDAHRQQVRAVMVGVGAAFDFHAGVKRQAPAWMQRLGLEWLFRLGQEPRRLWRRYFYNNPRFLLLALADLLGFGKK